MYNLRMAIAFTGTAFIPYFLEQQLLTIPLTLGVVAAGLSDIDDRFSVRIRTLIITYIGFFITASAVQLLTPYPLIFGLGLIVACFCLILLGSLGKRYAAMSYGCLVISVYAMLGADLFEEWYLQPALLTTGAIWYGILSTLSFLLFPVRVVQDQLKQCYRLLGQFLFIKSNLFDVDMTPETYQASMIELSMSNVEVTSIFNDTRVALQTRLKGDRGQKDTRRSLQYYFVVQDIHERADAAHIDYQQLAKEFKHSDILFRFQRILSLQGKACQDLAHSIEAQEPYRHNHRFQLAFKNLESSLQQLEQEQQYDAVWLNALRGLKRNLKEIDNQLINLQSEPSILNQYQSDHDHRLVDDDLTGWADIKQRIRQNFSPESGLFRHAMRLSILLVIAYVIVQVGGWDYGSWLLLTILFVCQPNFNATKRRLKLRIVGTLAGLAIGVFIMMFIPSILGQLFLLVLSGILFFQLRSQQYAQATLFITLLALINLQLHHASFESIPPRALFTIGGCFLAWLGIMFLWPDWKYRQISKVINNSLKSQCNYLAEIIKQYHDGRNNGLNYRIMRRRAHVMDAELASTISTWATEPNIDADQKQKAFKFLCLNHTLLSYIAALGSHRQALQDPEIFKLLDLAFDDIQGALLHAETPELKIQMTLNQLREQIKQSEPNSSTTLVLQQITLMLNLLPELSHLAQALSSEDDSMQKALSPLSS